MGAPDRVEVMNYLELPMAHEASSLEAKVHAAKDYHRGPWQDYVYVGAHEPPPRPGAKEQWIESVWLCKCHRSFLCPLSPFCADKTLLQSAVRLGKKKGWHVPLLLVTYHCQFWQWQERARPIPAWAAEEEHDRARAGRGLPQWLRDAKRLPAYVDDEAMVRCGKFLRQWTNVTVCVGFSWGGGCKIPWGPRYPYLCSWDRSTHKVHLFPPSTS